MRSRSVCSASFLIFHLCSSSLTPNALHNGVTTNKATHLTAENLPALDAMEEKLLEETYVKAETAAKEKAIHSFEPKIKPEQASALAAKLGSAVIDKLGSYTPGQPATIVTTFLSGIAVCLYEREPPAKAYSCGLDKVRELGHFPEPTAPEVCTSRLGQLEIPGTGWPAPCHDPSSPQHPTGNSAKRGLLRAFCKAAELLQGDELTEMGRRNGELSCDDKFPSDDKIEADAKAARDKASHAQEQVAKYREGVEEKVQSGGIVSQDDVNKAASMIIQGDLESVNNQDKKDAIGLAKQYLLKIEDKDSSTPSVPKKSGGSKGSGTRRENYRCFSHARLRRQQPLHWEKMMEQLEQQIKLWGDTGALCEVCRFSKKANDWQVSCSPR